MLILPSNARDFLGIDAISQSEFATLANCEKKWEFQYNTTHQDIEPSEAMALGSEMHRLLGKWWVEGITHAETENPTAAWLMDRYTAQYYGEQWNIRMLNLEVPFVFKLGDTYVFGYMDGIALDILTGEHWVVEFKTMGNWSKLNQLPVDKQVTLYIQAARAMGYNVKGVMYEAINTTQWKTEEGAVYKSGPKKGQLKDFHPAADSFRRIFVERTDDEIVECLTEVAQGIMNRQDLRSGNRIPLRNVGMNCDWCAFQAQCFGYDLTLLPELDTAF